MLRVNNNNEFDYYKEAYYNITVRSNSASAKLAEILDNKERNIL